MTTETNKKQHKPGKSRAADGFVMMAMAIVTLALCIGLVAQVGLSFWLAVTVSAAFYVGLLTLHTLVRRHDQLDELRAEVDRLTAEVTRLNHGGAPAARMPAPAPPAARASMPPPAVSAAPAPPVADARDPLARVAAAMPPLPSMHPDAQPSPVAAGAEDMSEEAGHPSADAALRGDRRDRPAAQMQKIVRAPQTKNADEMRTADTDLPLASPPPPQSGPRIPQDRLSGISRTRRVMAAEVADGSAPAAAGQDKTGVSDASSAPPVFTKPVADIEPLPAESRADADQIKPVAVPEPSFESKPDEAADAWAFRPGDDARAAGFSPTETDVAMIQGLIRKLADEVNATDAEKLALNKGRAALDDEAVDRSVGALRQAARNMQEPSTGSRVPRAGKPAAVPQAAPDDEASSRPAPALSNPPPPAAADPAPAQADAASQPGDVFDVEALMRRAQPIATMTSMPPPLPAAPNVMDPARKPSQGEAEPAEPGAIGDVHDDIWDVADDTAAADVPDGAVADSTERRLARIADAIEAGRVDVFLEPILDLEKRQARHFEVSVRLRDEEGAELAPDDAAETARPSGAMPLLDAVRLRRTAQVARRLDERNKQGNVFSTFCGQSLTADNFLSSFAETYDAQVQLAGQLVLTFSQADARNFRTPHWTMITEMRDLGFSFALRAVTDLDMDFELLANAGFKYVKLDAGVFLAGLPAPGALVPAADLCKHFDGLGLTPVVEAIDDDAKREEIASLGVKLGQGHLFGGPRQIKTAGNTADQSAAA